MHITHCDAKKRPVWGAVSSLLSFCFSGIREAKMKQPSKQRLRVKSEEASSFDLRTSDRREQEGLVLHPAEQGSAFDLLELNCSCNKNADTTTNWETKAFPVVGEPLQKHHSLDWSAILFGACPNSKPADVAGRHFNSKGPIMRTKSTPFELVQHRDTQELDNKENVSCLESQPHNSRLEQAQKARHVSSAELNYSLLSDSQHPMCNASDKKRPDSCALNVHSYMSLEDPYFLSLSPSSAASKMSLDLPEKADGNVLPCSSLPAPSTALFPCYNSHDSLALSPPTSCPPRNPETAVVGKLFLDVYMAFEISLCFYRRFGFFLCPLLSFSASFSFFLFLQERVFMVW